MNYQETLEFLFAQLPMYQNKGKQAYKANLSNTLELDTYFNHPHKEFKTIHVAGTNGKGSVSHCLASVLQEAGYRVGLYTSPHLKDFRERIRVNGDCISECDVVDFVDEHKAIIEKIKPSFFEMTVAMAFKYFADQKVDVAVVEVGLGGRLDSTNIITPDCSVITNIGMDHVALLGNTMEQIAAEKAGVIKNNIPVVIGERHPNTEGVFQNKSEEIKTTISFAQDLYSLKDEGLIVGGKQIFQVYKDVDLKYKDLRLDLLGRYQRKNILTVLTVIDILINKDYHIDKESIYRGCASVINNTSLLGRWHMLSEEPKMICDTGHNKDGVTEVVNQLLNMTYDNLHIVWGMVNDKDVKAILSLLPVDATYYFACPNIARGLNASILKGEAEKIGLRGEIYNSVGEAKKEAKKNALANDLIFIGGSTFVVAEVL